MTATPAEQAPTTPVGALPAAVTDLLAAIRDALDVPLADRPVDDAARAELLTRRASDARVVVELLLAHGDIAHSTARLREWTAEHPVSYATWQARIELAAAEEKQLLDEDEKGVATADTPGGDHLPGASKKVPGTGTEVVRDTVSPATGDVDETEAVRRSVNAQFPAVAAFLNAERGEAQ